MDPRAQFVRRENRRSVLTGNGAGREFPYPVHSAEGFGMWPWDDGNELPRVIQVIRVKGSCTFSFLRRFPYRVQRLLWQLLTHPFPSCQYADNLSWVHGVLRVLYINVSKFPRHVTAVVKVIECIFERPLHHSRAEGRQFEIVRSSPRVPTQPAENQTDSRCQNASRTGHRNFAYSALASFRIGMSGSASFQRARKS